MSSLRDHIKTLRERRENLRADFEAAKARFEECDSLLRALEGTPIDEPPQSDRKPRRGDLKDIVLTLLEEAGEFGLSSHGCVQWAREKRGVDLHPGSVSSLLSRLKSDDIVFFDGERYRLKQYAGPRNPAARGIFA